MVCACLGICLYVNVSSDYFLKEKSRPPFAMFFTWIDPTGPVFAEIIWTCKFLLLCWMRACFGASYVRGTLLTSLMSLLSLGYLHSTSFSILLPLYLLSSTRVQVYLPRIE